jgi:heme A synthase
MSGWLERWRNRQRELADGVDAELVQANRRRFRVAFGLIGLAFVVGLLDARLHLPHVLDVVLRCAAAVAGVVGIVMAKWAQQEDTFLKRPESEGPPTIFKE